MHAQQSRKDAGRGSRAMRSMQLRRRSVGDEKKCTCTYGPSDKARPGKVEGVVWDAKGPRTWEDPECPVHGKKAPYEKEG